MTEATSKSKLQPYAEVRPYITKDGSEIRELMHPTVHGNQVLICTQI